MPSLDASFPGLITALTEHYGRIEEVRAGFDAFEAMVATVLNGVTDLKKSASARAAWREDGLLEPIALAEADLAELTESLRAAGVAIPEKSLAPIRKLARWVVDRHCDDLDEIVGNDAPIPTAQLRDELLAIPGIGPATADAVLLFAFRRASYPVDRATYRILIRHGWLDTSADYDEARSTVETPHPDDPSTLIALSHWFDRVGHDFCRASVAKCDRCPLAFFLPDGGPIDPSS
jgi:endonuclease-3 related protein